MGKSFKALYEEQKNKPTAAQAFITEVAKLTKRSEATVRMWLSGQQVPDSLVQNVIANHYGVSADTLFSEK